MRLYYAAMALFVLAVGVRVCRPGAPLARRALAGRKSAVTAPAPTAAVRVPMATATPIAAAVVSPPHGDPAPAVTLVTTGAPTPGVTPRKRTRGRGPKGTRGRDDEALTAGDQTAIPPDRK
jgi:hypothetical protein